MINQTEQTIYRLSNLDALQQKISYQMSTGKKLENGSDDSSLYAREIFVDDKIRTFEGIKTQMEITDAQNNVSDSSVAEIKKILESIKSELIKANTSTTSENGMSAIAANLEGMKQNLLDLVNTQSGGEYLFSGSDSSLRPFSQDVDGKVSYLGNNILKKVAVEEGSYRDKGLVGFDVATFSSSTAYKGETLTFNEEDRILDQDGNEWKMREPVANEAETLSFSVDPSVTTVNIIDGNNKIWTLDTTTAPTFTLDDPTGGPSVPVTYDSSTSSYSLVVPSGSKNMGINELVKYNLDNEIVIPEEILIPIAGENGREIITPLADGTKFEARTSIFKILDDTVNSLKSLDSDGNPIPLIEAREGISKGLGYFEKAYDSVNVSHAELGGKNKVFEVSLERVSSKLTHYNILSQEIGAADLSKVAMESKALELTYTALYSTINRTNQLSLVNFLN